MTMSAEIPGPFCGHNGRQCQRIDSACLRSGMCLGLQQEENIHRGDSDLDEFFKEETCGKALGG